MRISNACIGLPKAVLICIIEQLCLCLTFMPGDSLVLLVTCLLQPEYS